MAGHAIIAGRHMDRGLSTGDHAIVTTDTGADDVTVLHRVGGHRYPRCGGVVTGIADVGALYVG